MRAGIDNPAVVQALNARFIEFENSLEDIYGVFAPQRRALGVFDFRSRKTLSGWRREARRRQKNEAD